MTEGEDQQLESVRESAREAVSKMEEGMSVRAIASIMGTSPMTAHRDIVANREAPDEDGMVVISKTMGLDGKVRPSRRFDTTERDQIIISLRAEGKPLREIAESAGCSVGTAHRVVRQG